jgi:ribosomal protein L40E
VFVKEKKLHKQICPRCGGPIFPFIGFAAGLIYECKRCGYHGPLALNEEDKENLPKIKK